MRKLVMPKADIALTGIQPLAGLDLLHPVVKLAVENMLADLDSLEIPVEVAETYRSPQRQQYIYSQGRTRPGKILTGHQAWDSYHQYGLAVDWRAQAGFPVSPDQWETLERIGWEWGLEVNATTRHEHLQMPNLDIAELKAGILPGAGSREWWDRVEQGVREWRGQQAAPNLG